ncbi:MAG: thiolase family protein [Halobacteriales archaeon]|nr:thiolase family protein [Halobacteriales archaeon]
MTGIRVVVASAVRTPIGKFKGAYAGVPATKLGSVAVAEALRRARLEPRQVSELFFGSVIQAGLGQNPARQVLLGAGIPASVSGTTINMVCGSGMKSMAEGVRAIEHDPQAIVVAGGAENMTRAPYLLPKARMGLGLGNQEVVDSMIHDGIWDAHHDHHMGMAGELIARKLAIPRAEVDAFALRSHARAEQATRSGRFAKEIVPVHAEHGGKAVRVEHDEGIRPTSLEALGKLKPAFLPDGVLTAGNASQISDGASATVLMGEAKARDLGIEPLGTIVDFCSFAVPPEDVMFAPIPCTQKLLKRTGLRIQDLDLVEHNEAFSSASLGVQRELGIPDDIFNIHGGAVALGHPIGCSGNRIVTTLLHSMVERDAHRGLATLCIGGGDAMSMVLER